MDSLLNSRHGIQRRCSYSITESPVEGREVYITCPFRDCMISKYSSVSVPGVSNCQLPLSLSVNRPGAVRRLTCSHEARRWPISFSTTPPAGDIQGHVPFPTANPD